MAITVQDMQDDMNTYIGDSSTNSITAVQRLSAISEATARLSKEIQNDHMIDTVDVNHLDTVFYYKITTTVPDLIEPVDLRIKRIDQHTIPATRKGGRELLAEIGSGDTEFSYAIERRNNNQYLVINFSGRFQSTNVSGFDATDDGGGTWVVDSSNSDATNITIDTNEFLEGSASLNFDIDVSQSGNDKATIQNTTLTALDLSSLEDLGEWIFDVYIPDVTNFSSITFYWGSDTSNYWSATNSTDIDGSAFINGWNRIKVAWSEATKTLSPDVTAIDYIAFDYNYTNSQTDDTDFRLDDLRIVRPEAMRFYYLSWDVGESSGGTAITEFANTTDVPFFSGHYDHYRYYVAHKSAGILFRAMHQYEEGQFEELEAQRELDKIVKIFPQSKAPEVKSFKVHGVNLTGRRR